MTNCISRSACVVILICATLAFNVEAKIKAPAKLPTTAPSTRPAGELFDAIFEGGHDLDKRDGGRPVVLIAAALGVTDEVFREAFSHVRPARDGRPSPDEARKNKDALLSRLSKHGVTNDRLDEVSNFYRYRPQENELWTHRDARASAIVRDGKIVGFDIIDAGAGYSSPPRVTIKGIKNVTILVKLDFNSKLETNGAIKSMTVEAPVAK